MRTFGRIMRTLALMCVELGYVACWRVKRRIEWFFLYRAIRKNAKLFTAFKKVVARAFIGREGALKLSMTLHSRRGYRRSESTEERKTFYWEAPIGVAIWTVDGPAIGMAVEFRHGAICIRQLQGVAGVRLPKDLSTDWQRVFIGVCVSFARMAKMREVRVYRANQSLFYYYPILPRKKDETRESRRQDLEAHQQRMRRRYDGTARQLGFTSNRCWYTWMNPNSARP